MTTPITAQLLARALRAAAAVLDGEARRAEAPQTSTSNAQPRHATRGVSDAFEARTDRKLCEACGQRVDRGARVVWGEGKGELVHEACATARTTAAPSPSSTGPADDPEFTDDDEIPF